MEEVRERLELVGTRGRENRFKGISDHINLQYFSACFRHLSLQKTKNMLQMIRGNLLGTQSLTMELCFLENP